MSDTHWFGKWLGRRRRRLINILKNIMILENKNKMVKVSIL